MSFRQFKTRCWNRKRIQLQRPEKCEAELPFRYRFEPGQTFEATKPGEQKPRMLEGPVYLCTNSLENDKSV